MTGLAPAPAAGASASFSLAAARSASLSMGLAAVVAIEGAVVHLWLAARHPAVAWASTLLTIAALAWLAADYLALGRATLRVDERAIRLDVGRRWRATIPRTQLAAAERLTWRTVPAHPAPDYRDLTKPGEPTVLLTLAEPVTLRGPGGAPFRARRLGLRLEPADADALLALLDAARPAATDAA